MRFRCAIETGGGEGLFGHDGLMTEVRGRVWKSGEAQDDFAFERISDYLADDAALVWACLLYTSPSPRDRS